MPRIVAIASTSKRDQPAMRNTSSMASQGDVVAPAFLTPQPFLADRGNQPVILERRRRGIVEAGLKRKDTHAGTGWDLRKKKPQKYGLQNILNA